MVIPDIPIILIAATHTKAISMLAKLKISYDDCAVITSLDILEEAELQTMPDETIYLDYDVAEMYMPLLLEAMPKDNSVKIQIMR